MGWAPHLDSSSSGNLAADTVSGSPCMVWLPPDQSPLVTSGATAGSTHAVQGEPETEKVASLHLLQGHRWSSLDEAPITHQARSPSSGEQYKEVALMREPGKK